MKPAHMIQTINRVRYDTSKATLIASDEYWDGHGWERCGRNTFLYKTPSGRFFVVHRSLWVGERDKLIPLSAEDAYSMYEELPVHEVEASEAFPDIQITDA